MSPILFDQAFICDVAHTFLLAGMYIVMTDCTAVRITGDTINEQSLYNQSCPNQSPVLTNVPHAKTLRPAQTVRSLER
jgi:hypothetical protein